MVELHFSNGHETPTELYQSKGGKGSLKNVTKKVNANHEAKKHFANTCDKEEPAQVKSLQKSLEVKSFQPASKSMHLIVAPTLIKSENLADNTIRQVDANGVSEDFISHNGYYKGTRRFPNGNQETGEFDEDRNLLSGYRIEGGKIEFINPNSLASYQEPGGNSEFIIYDVEEELVVLEKTWENSRYKYVRTNRSVTEILLKASQRPSYGDGKSIKEVLSHKSFEKDQIGFIKHLLTVDQSGVSLLFGLSNSAALDVVEIIESKGNPNLIGPISKPNFIIQAAYWGSATLLKKLSELFPQEFVSSGQEIIAKLLLQGHPTDLVCQVAERLKHLGGELDSYHELWIQVAQGVKLNKTFEEQFNLLSKEKQQTLYKSAFIYNNPFIHEPADPPITANQYSINLMWINKNKISPDQEFLFGNGATVKEQKADFYTRFIQPISNWAIANPGSRINIWVDGEMATKKAIKQSKTALEENLKGTSHGEIQFRDVRSIEVVQSNPDAFSGNIPIYFRVDLLRAIAADYTLKQKETTFFVYGDLDMEPLSAKELFDQRTVNFLNEFGFVMAKGGWLGFENGFQILNGNNPQFMDSHRKVIINNSIEMAREKPNTIKDQQIYDTYPAMLTHVLDADGRYGKLIIKDNENNEELDKLRMFRYDRFGTSAHFKLPLKKEGKTSDVETSNVMPRKPVRLPPSHF
jgi:hypothetical protein